ncbi:hypothetical protein Cgig2_013181 [Carnegiea gigantea]|uniref:Uncharacterized protein n=1 Tax=Carnegiea gigantea TaxID=171969 RepID=A0A9Q1JJT9_9CARY|nr:hypothetical protein Cgig2_013181 [Carnegiea gigantea]
MRRSATVRESSSRASRDMAYEQMSTPAARLRAVEVELEKDRTRTKQSKVNTSWLKAGKNKMIKAFGSWVIDTNVPFTVVDSTYTNPLLETIHEVGPDVFLYKDRMDTFGTSIAQRAIASLMPCGGDRGNGGANEMGASYSSRRSTDYFSDRDRDRDRGRGVPLKDDRSSRRSPNEQPSEPTQTYRRIRKGKEPAQPHGYPTDAMYGYVGFQEAPSSFTGPGLFASSGGHDTYGGFSNNYGYNTNCPPLPYPSNEP